MEQLIVDLIARVTYTCFYKTMRVECYPNQSRHNVKLPESIDRVGTVAGLPKGIGFLIMQDCQSFIISTRAGAASPRDGQLPNPHSPGGAGGGR